MKEVNPWDYHSAYSILFKDTVEILNDEYDQNENIKYYGVFLQDKNISQEIKVKKENLFNNLSKESKEVIEFILYDPNVCMIQTEKTGKINFKLLTKYFEMKWKSKFICHVVFEEIRDWVKTF